MRRRDFLRGSAALSFAALARSPDASAQDRAPRGIPLGFDTYSLRAFGWKAIQLIDYAANLRLDTIQISALEDYESLDPAYLATVREHARKSGISLDGGMGCICPLSKSWSQKNGDPIDNILHGLRASKAIGATSMRCFMGTSADRTPTNPIEPLMEETIRIFRTVRAQALDMGVKVALENHAGDMQAWEVKTIIEESGKDSTAACLDTGNPIWAIEDPMVALETLAPYVVTTHVRDSAVYETPGGAAWQWVALGDGSIDFHSFIARFRELCPGATMQLEIITGRPARTMPYLEPEFWKAFPKARADEFARFVALAKNGHPFNGFMIVEDGSKDAPPEYKAALREQQRFDLERSLEYAKKQLGVGIRWRS